MSDDIKPVAWMTFEGEAGIYDLRLYEYNENYRDVFIRRNGERYASWVEPLYDQATVEALQAKVAELESNKRGAFEKIVDQGVRIMELEEANAMLKQTVREESFESAKRVSDIRDATPEEETMIGEIVALRAKVAEQQKTQEILLRQWDRQIVEMKEEIRKDTDIIVAMAEEVRKLQAMLREIVEAWDVERDWDNLVGVIKKARGMV